MHISIHAKFGKKLVRFESDVNKLNAYITSKLVRFEFDVNKFAIVNYLQCLVSSDEDWSQ